MSDLHVPQTYPSVGPTGLAERVSRIGLRTWTLRDEHLKSLLFVSLQEAKPDAIVISGDLFEQSPHWFSIRAAVRFLNELTREVACTNGIPIWFVLGNHDVRLLGIDLIPARFGLILLCAVLLSTLEIWAFTFGDKAFYAWLFASLFIGCFALECSVWLLQVRKGTLTTLVAEATAQEAQRIEITKPSWASNGPDNSTISSPFNVEVVGFDTTASIGLLGFATGTIRSFEIGQNLHRKTADTVRVAVLHHHPLPLLKESFNLMEPTQLLRDAGAFLAWCFRNDIDAILHGHKHIAEAKNIESNGKQMLIASCGTMWGDANPQKGASRGYGILRIRKFESRLQIDYKNVEL